MQLFCPLTDSAELWVLMPWSVLWQGQGIWGEAVEICICTEVAERGKHGRARDAETFAFLLKRIAFLKQCANNTCHSKLLVCADGLEDQLKGVLNYRGTASTKGEWSYVLLLLVPGCGAMAGQPVMRLRITYRSARVWLQCFISCCQKSSEVENHQVIEDYWLSWYSNLL